MLKRITMFTLMILLICPAVSFATNETDIFKKNHEKFVKNYMAKLSQGWDVEQVRDLSTKYFMSQITTPNGQYVLRMYQVLGKLEETKDINVSVHKTAAGDVLYVFELKAAFEKGLTLVKVVVQKKDNVVKVHGINMDRLSDEDWE